MTIRPEHQKTFPRARIAETLMMFLRLRGGAHAAMDAALAYGPLADYYQLPDQTRTLSNKEYYGNQPKNGLAWESEVRVAAKSLKDDGYLTSATRSDRLVWRLTAKGAERADFWLVRMTEKTNALKALAANTQLEWLDTNSWAKEIESS